MKLNKIGIIHLNQIGDLAFSLPLLLALKQSHPHASIHSIIRPYLAELLADSPWVDQIILRKNGIREKIRLLREIRNQKYDLLISLAASEESLFLSMLSHARTRIGFRHFPWDLGMKAKETIEGHNSWRNNKKLLKHLDVKVTKDDYVGLFHFNNTQNSLELPAEFAVISPGASKKRQMKTWPPEKFSELIFLLYKEYGFTSILVGSAENKSFNEKIIQLNRDRTGSTRDFLIDYTGATSLKALCFMLKNTRLFVGIDSGIMHLASAMDIPVVGLFGPTDPYHVGPQNKHSVVVKEENMECLPCLLKPCPHSDCMGKLEVSKVFRACKTLLNRIH